MSSEINRKKNSEDLFAGRGSPALMSSKEPSIKLLKERYSESFAIASGPREGQVHLFLIKLGMWALVWTFTRRDFDTPSAREKFEVQDALGIILSALEGKNSAMLEKIDKGVSNALERIQLKLKELHLSPS